jgi:hypothetical protein
MKTIRFLFFSLSLLFSANLLATDVNISFNSIQTTLTNILDPVTTDLFVKSRSWECKFANFPVFIGAPVKKFRYILKKQSFSGAFIEVQSFASNATTWNFSNLSDGRYKVELIRSFPGSEVVVDQARPCTAIGRIVSTGTSIDRSDEFTVGPVIVDPFLLDLSDGDDGVPIDGVVCYDEQDDIFVGPSSSHGGEQEHMISICYRNTNDQNSPNCTAWTSTGWEAGELTFTRLIDVWQEDHPGWNFWGGEYEVQVTIRKVGCVGWLSETLDFTSTSTAECRKENEEEILAPSLYPNPATNTVNLMGIDVLENGAEYFVSDVSGRMISRGVLASGAKSIDVQNFANGMYILTLVHEYGRNSMKFSIAK